MKYIVECEKKIKCVFVVDADNDEQADKKLVAGEYEKKVEIVETYPVYMGYEYKGCEKYSGEGDETVICSIEGLCNYLGTTTEHLERYMYKNTECGMPIYWDNDKVSLTVYAEGADPEWSYDLLFPFTAKEFNKMVEVVEEESDYLWHEWNDDGEEE